MTLFFSLQDWLAITGALTAALTPLYLISVRAEKHIADMKDAISEMKGIVINCPYCMRRNEP